MAANSVFRDVSTLQRGLAVIAFLCRERDVGFNTIAAHLGLAPTIVSRLLKDLIAGEWVERDPDSGHYTPGRRIGDLQLGAPTSEQARILAEPILRELSVNTGNTALLVWRAGHVPLAKVTHENAIAMRPVGHAFDAPTRYPWGWWFIADLSSAERDDIINQEKDATWRKRTLSACAMAQRVTFFALRITGSVRLAAPVRTRSGELLAALALGGTNDSLPERRHARYGAQLAEAATRLGRMLG